MCDCTSVRILFHKKKTVTARKPHHCIECAALIAPNTKYVSASGGQESDQEGRRVWRISICLTCDQAWNDLVTASNGEICIVFGTLGHCTEEAIDADYIKADDPLVLAQQSAIANGYVSDRQAPLPF